MIVATVLKTGGIYTSEHVRMLEDQLGHDVPLTVYTDDLAMCAERRSLARRLTYNFPGWWSKMELFNPALPDDIVFFDLDTVIRRRPRLLLDPVTQPMMLRDFNHPERLQSSIMCIPHYFKTFIWKHWMEGPEEWMELLGETGLGDQAFIDRVSHKFWGILQDKYPNEYVSWKVDRLAKRPVPTLARVIVFHGQPKPWDLPYACQTWRH